MVGEGEKLIRALGAAATVEALEACQALPPVAVASEYFLHQSCEACRKHYPDAGSMAFDIFMFKVFFLSQRTLDRSSRKFFHDLNQNLRLYKSGDGDAAEIAKIQARNYNYYRARRQTLICIGDRLPGIIEMLEAKARELLARKNGCVNKVEQRELAEKLALLECALGSQASAASLDNLHGLVKQIAHERVSLDFHPATSKAGPFRFKQHGDSHLPREFELLHAADLKNDSTVNALTVINVSKIHKPLHQFSVEKSFLSNVMSTISDTVIKAAKINGALGFLSEP